MKFGVVSFPGSCDDVDAQSACARVGESVALWHADHDLAGVDVVVIPGGFSYGDYLRAGAIARFAPIMTEVVQFARAGGYVIGICNGFQVCCEAGLLPGALLPNVGRRFVCRQVTLELVNADTPFTRTLQRGDLLAIPVKHTTGRYYAPPDMLARMGDGGQIVLRYAPGQNPNGSLDDIAGLMPHPEHAVDQLTGSSDGLALFTSLVAAGAPA
jgi:phosphoribosylformylglycinamidine synthase